jgi:hypothetical protein
MRVALPGRPQVVSMTPDSDFVSSLDIEDTQLIKELISVTYRTVKRIRHAIVPVLLRPHLRAVSARDVGNAALVPMASAHDAGASAPAPWPGSTAWHAPVSTPGRRSTRFKRRRPRRARRS